jgi:SAM-dependent methyltransferase
VIEGRLISKKSGKSYPIQNGIVRFVDMDGYTDSFGMQWNKFSKVQLDSANGADYSRERFETETTWTQAELQGKWVLDAGCGSGRFAEIAASKGARLIALDYSSAVDAARNNLKDRFPEVQFIQGDILNLPFAPESLDFIYSIGVLQHTPAPGRCIGELIQRVRQNGRFCFTIYGRKWSTMLYSKYLIRPITKRMPQKMLLRLIEISMPILFPLTDILFRLPGGLGKVFSFLIPVATYVDRTKFTRAQRYEEAILDTFDMLSPTFDQPMSVAELKASLAQASIAPEDYKFPTRTICNVTGVRTSVKNTGGTH